MQVKKEIPLKNTMTKPLSCLLGVLACCLPLAAQNNTTKPKAKPMGVWTDPATHLMWTSRDLAVDMTGAWRSIGVTV